MFEPPPVSRAPLPDLPVVPVLRDVALALADHRGAVLVAPPGAGKTTLVPLALLDADWLGDRKIIVLEPRRLAARSAAHRMASLLGEDDAGGTVGYRVRMDTKVGPRTRIEVVTEGVLTRMLIDDPALAGVGLVVFDEFHERSLHTDLGLALTLQSRQLLRDDLRLLVMSATLDPTPVAKLLDDAPIVRSEGRSHPVGTRFRDRPIDGWIEPPTVAAVLDALEADEGDILVFLPGAGEIRRTADRLREAGLPSGVDLHPLFGALPRDEQDRAIAPSPPGRRKIVLATSIAETSLTIEGVRVVVDSGLMRVPRFDPRSGMTRLATVTVTRDSADQRRGRAGRTNPGVCYRMWTEGEDRGLVPTRRPEIEEADLAPLALDLAVWGARPEELRWMTPPPAALLAQASELLTELDAIDENGVVTEHGRDLAGAGVHPRLAHMLVRGRELGHGGVACDVAALLGDRDILDGPGRPPDADLRLRVEAMRRARAQSISRVASVGGQQVRRGALHRALQESRHLRRSLDVPDRDGGPAEVEQVGLLLAFAYPDRIARRREGSRGRFLLRNGKGAELGEGEGLGDAEWIVAADLDDRGRDARIFRAAPVDQEEIERHFAGQVRTVEEVVWRDDARRVEARRREQLGAITVREASLATPSRDAVVAALVDGIRSEGVGSLPWTKDAERLRERLVFLHGLEPERWPDRSDEALLAGLETWLVPFLSGLASPRRLDDLKSIDFEGALLSGVAWEGRARLDTWAPTHLDVPSGARVPIDYSDPGAPALEVRLQQVFGMTETPRIGGGRVPLTMKLLSPAHRPVQVTRDLKSFWRDAYFEVRKDLRGRYPKHPWPEDPLVAEPTNRTKRY
jgi:ATP-dependent helicase HrpB